MAADFFSSDGSFATLAAMRRGGFLRWASQF
jgi:hypothetical protein